MTFIDFAIEHPFGVAFGLILAVLIAGIFYAVIAADGEA